MRSVACESWVELSKDMSFVFLTGDLGFMALEPLREVLGHRFINAGIAEQNMISVAAGMSIENLRPWVYSIAPFCYARPFEQIRNDVCHHQLPVKIVGNGGGFSYGPMGASHHALEDYGALLTLSGMTAFVPAFSDDIRELIPKLHDLEQPAYLRLGRCEKPFKQKPSTWSQWRKLLGGAKKPIILVGPIAGEYWKHCLEMPYDKRPELWVLGQLPLIRRQSLPSELLESIISKGVAIVEEHVEQGSAGQQLSSYLHSQSAKVSSFKHYYAVGFPPNQYGSQQYHRRVSGLSADIVISELDS